MIRFNDSTNHVDCPIKGLEHENQHAPLSYHGAWRIVWLVFLLVIVWLILRALQPVILLFALVFLLAMVLNPIVVWLEKHHVPRFVSVILLMLALIAVTTTIIVFAIPPLARQTQELVRSAPSVWHGIRIRIESLTLNYPAVREALPRTDEIAGKIGASAGTVGNILLRSTIGFVGGVASFVLAILLLVFVLANPRPLVAAYLALAPDRYREQAHRTLARLMRQMTAWARGVTINGVITGLSIGVLLWLIGVQPGAHLRRVRISRRVSAKHRRVSRFDSHFAGRAEPGRDKILARHGRDPVGLSSRAEPSGGGRARQGDAIASGQHFVFYTGDRRIVWVAGSFSRRPGRRAGADRNRRILFATAQTQLRRARSRSRCAGRREKGKTVTADQSCTVL